MHVDVASLGVDFRPALAWTLAGSLAHFRFDDGNERDRAYGRVERTIVAVPRVRAGIEALAFRSSDPTGPAVAWRGYWNPKEYREARLFVSVSRDWREWQVAARAGLISDIPAGSKVAGYPARLGLGGGLGVGS